MVCYPWYAGHNIWWCFIPGSVCMRALHSRPYGVHSRPYGVDSRPYGVHSMQPYGVPFTEPYGVYSMQSHCVSFTDPMVCIPCSPTVCIPCPTLCISCSSTVCIPRSPTLCIPDPTVCIPCSPPVYGPSMWVKSNALQGRTHRLPTCTDELMKPYLKICSATFTKLISCWIPALEKWVL